MGSKYTPSDREPIRSRMLSMEELEREKAEHLRLSHSTNFEVFRKVPKFHTAGAIVINCVEKQGLSVKAALAYLRMNLSNMEKTLIYSTTTHIKEIDYIVKTTKIFEECPFLDIYVMKILIAQLLWGVQSIPLGTRESTHLLYYEMDLKEAFVEADTVLGNTYLSELPVYVRVNTLCISLEQCINAFCKENWNLLECPKNYDDYLAVVSDLKENTFIRDFHISELLVFPPGTSFYSHPGYLRGKFVLQNKGSCLASFLLNPKPGSRVLDMCAAPGKTTNHLANIVNNEAKIYAIDSHPHRYNHLYSFLQLTNSKCVETIMSEAKIINLENLNYVLIDAPSTYTGVFYQRKRDGMGRRLKQYYHASFRLLIYALQKFKSAKRIVYASCTSFPEEGEKVVEFALKRVGDSYKLLDVKELLWNQWSSVGQVEAYCGNYPFATKCLRTNPDIDKCHGYFIAVFERNFDVPVPASLFEEKFDKEKDIMNYAEEESDDESLHGDNSKRKQVFKRTENKVSKVRPFKKVQKVYYPNLKNNYPKVYPHTQTSQTTTLANQKQDNYPYSRPFYETYDSQLYP